MAALGDCPPGETPAADVTLPPAFAAELSDRLLADAPSPRRLTALLSARLRVTPSVARLVLRESVRRLNLALFPPLAKVELFLTGRCNLACAYCFAAPVTGSGSMTADVARAGLDLLFDYSGSRSQVTVTFFGGEPTLNDAVLRDATEYAERRAEQAGKLLSLTMTSNGLAFMPESVRYFAVHRIKVLLSVDGLQATHDRYRVDRRGIGSFARVRRALDLLKAEQPWIGVKMTVMPATVRDLCRDVIGLSDLGVNQFVIGHATGVDWSPQDIADYYQEFVALRRWYDAQPRSALRIADFEDDRNDECYFGCEAGRDAIAVAVNGEVSGCSKLLSRDSRRMVGKLGDVVHGLTHLRNRAAMISCRRLEENCAAAGIAAEYRGGCLANNYEMHGDLWQPSLQEHAFSVLHRAVRANAPFDVSAMMGDRRASPITSSPRYGCES